MAKCVHSYGKKGNENGNRNSGDLESQELLASVGGPGGGNGNTRRVEMETLKRQKSGVVGSLLQQLCMGVFAV